MLSAQKEEEKKKEEENETMDLRRKGSLDMLNFKLKKHKLKIHGIIKRYSDEQVNEEGKDRVRIDHLKDIFNDFSYICAIVFCM